ncbi:hypothetical protein ZHAS_00006824 [Anopheles sinensis]|uniref:Uncharacterized protein n=1 Tax=Anopheles sinensis TaxID=74873 RepID=A0A084VN02_ANOSI|nr:hypothetical protein ZHAS_00006824 [Anopheles sinensis]
MDVVYVVTLLVLLLLLAISLTLAAAAASTILGSYTAPVPNAATDDTTLASQTAPDRPTVEIFGALGGVLSEVVLTLCSVSTTLAVTLIALAGASVRRSGIITSAITTAIVTAICGGPSFVAPRKQTTATGTCYSGNLNWVTSGVRQMLSLLVGIVAMLPGSVKVKVQRRRGEGGEAEQTPKGLRSDYIMLMMCLVGNIPARLEVEGHIKTKCWKHNGIEDLV